MEGKLRLKEIEIDNFKSFGKKTIVPFLPGFTTISGPNGSGKSNIIDSILFALGLSTSRTMRAERLPDLINNLSGKKEAQVTITFTDDNATDIEVTRKIRIKDADNYSSSYYMDGKGCTLTEVHDRLSKYNVSPQGYNVVMQGDVTSIISMSTLERRRIIDELAGVAEFDRKIELAKIELGKVQESVEKENIIMTELEERRKQLEGERNEAIKYAKLKEERRELERHCLAARINKVESELNTLKEENNSLRKKRTDSIIKQGKLNDEIEQDKQEIANIEIETQKITSENQKKILEEIETAKIEMSKTGSTTDFLNKQIKDHEENILRLQEEITSIDKKLSELERKKEKGERAKEKIEKEIEKLNKSYQSLQENLKAKGQNENLSTRKILEVQGNINKLKGQRDELHTKKTRLEEQNAHLVEDLENTKSEGEKSLAELKELTQSSDYKNSKLNQSQEKKASLQRHVSKLKAEEIETKEELNERKKKLAKLERELDKLEVHKEVVKQTNLGAAIDTVLNSGIKGIHGTLAQLAYVDEKYKTAIEVATGNRLKAIVVDNDGIAQKCIELLRSTNSGRATFLPLNKLKPAPTLLPVSQNGAIGWAIDLIKFENKYRDAFHYALSDTLVMEDLEHARKLLNKNRMVTLDGDLLEKSGAITGGSKSKTDMSFGISSKEEEQRLEREVNALRDYVTQLEKDLEELGNQIEEAKTEFDELKTEITKEEANNSALIENIKRLTKISDESKEKVTKTSETIEQNTKELEKLNEKVEDKEQQITNHEVELQKIAAGVKDSSLENLVLDSQEIEAKIKEYETNLQEIVTEAKSYSVEAEFNQKAKEQDEEKINKSNKEIGRIKGELPEYEEKLNKLQEKVTQLEGESKQESERLNELTSKRNELSNGLITKGEQKGEVSQLIEQLAERVTEIELKIRELEPDLTDLKTKFQEQTQNEEYKPLENIDLEKITRQIEFIEKRMHALEPVNMRAITEYDNVTQRQKEIEEKLKSLNEEKDIINQKIDSYTGQKFETFKETFEGVNKHFQEIFHDLSYGHGELAMENSEDLFNGGLIIRARPRDKKMQRLEAMSGGEKSLTALSFMFALQRYSPAPFYAFDEVDMFLDSFNAERLAQMVKQQSNNAQFIVVSLRRHMIDKAERAIGVTLRADGYTQVLGIQSIKNKQKEEPELMTA